MCWSEEWLAFCYCENMYSNHKRRSLHHTVAGSVFKKFESGCLFAGDDSFAGANRSASATVDAGVGVDVVDVTFRDSANGAFGEAGAASDTFVGNYVSHSSQF